MRVLHLPLGRNLPGLCNALREIGVDATSCHFREDALRFNANICLHLEQLERTARLDRCNMFLEVAMKNFDVFHFHYGKTFLPDYSDLAYLKSNGKKIVMQHLGSDVRQLSIARQSNNPYVLVRERKSAVEKNIIAKLQHLSSFIDHAIVSDRELVPYVQPYYKNVHIIRPPVDPNELQPYYPAISNDKPLIVHAPTNARLKGTQHVLQAIEKLQKKGYHFTFKLIENTARQEALKTYQKADIIIDQLLIGAIGMLSLESMALGKPTLCYVRPDLITAYPGQLPIVNANPLTIYRELKVLCKHPRRRNRLGLLGREYVETYHQPHHIAKQLHRLYLSL